MPIQTTPFESRSRTGKVVRCWPEPRRANQRPVWKAASVLRDADALRHPALPHGLKDPLGALELRLALLHKGADALASVTIAIGGEAGDGPGLQFHLRLQSLLEGAV